MSRCGPELAGEDVRGPPRALSDASPPRRSAEVTTGKPNDSCGRRRLDRPSRRPRARDPARTGRRELVRARSIRGPPWRRLQPFAADDADHLVGQ